MRLLIQCAYNTRYLSGKFTIGYVMEVKGAGIVNCTIGTAIPLESSSGNAAPNIDTYEAIEWLIGSKAEDYDKMVILGVTVRVYLAGNEKQGTQEETVLPLSPKVIYSVIWKVMEDAQLSFGVLPEVEEGVVSSHYPEYIPAIKLRSKEMRRFIVADIETILVNDVHVPYAAGFLVVRRKKY